MSVHKKLLTFFTLAVVVLIASATTTEAQGFRRRGHGRVVVVGGYYPYASPFWFGDPWYGYQYPWRPYGPYGPYGYYGFPEASVRLEVTPRDAEVYVDGYYAGTVDDFDGAFQRLRVEPGEHEIEVYREGFRPFRQKVYLTPDNTFRIRQALQPLAPGEQPEPRPQPLNPPPAAQGGQPSPGTPMPRGGAGRRMPPHRRAPTLAPVSHRIRAERAGAVGVRDRGDPGAAARCRDFDRRRELARTGWTGSAGHRPRGRLAHGRDSQARLSAPT